MVLRELEEVLTKPLSIIYQQSWLSGEVPVSWQLANVTHIHKKLCKEDLESYRPVSLTLMLGSVTEHLILSAITRHVQDNQVIRSIQPGFVRGRLFLTNLIFYDYVTCLKDDRKATVVFYPDFSEAFDTISHNVLLRKLAASGLDGHTLHWVKKWLDG